MKLYWNTAHQSLTDLALVLGGVDALELPGSDAAPGAGAQDFLDVI